MAARSLALPLDTMSGGRRARRRAALAPPTTVPVCFVAGKAVTSDAASRFGHRTGGRLHRPVLSATPPGLAMVSPAILADDDAMRSGYCLSYNKLIISKGKTNVHGSYSEGNQ
ncbi:hypothetical protein E2562_033155 [Oryza meyeriana var. granulata]|uniref:Uncharacterized protein n=1 Tax=Oryza meyeriana var. granulata TaxID=110450 RepID=A0A6G1DR94_9ORYZ|nr:hypothetical protein E2562_033155 [Oryza meyeriana var. granulata]